ncbi:MAG: 4Fe-4S dicluster domain-containing protein [Lachnospiraceae bacterium]|nr:4Fe-4S dicluster domain-containing protein [Lachnospiraceae bacterium]
MERYFGENIPKLGFGLMRLPKEESGKIDLEQTKKMVDLFMEAGQTYFDTAYTYDNGDSELTAKAALVERYPRESFTLATKINANKEGCDEQSVKQQFYTSLERTGAGYFDYYLLHAIQSGSYKTYEQHRLWDFVKEQKAKGLIRHWGFSFHAGPDLLHELLTAHPDAEFVQLQINYADWENPNVLSRANYEVARKHGKSVVIMEPVKGGMLAAPPETVREIFQKADPKASMASWAVRYAASLDGILTVLSGMSSVEQMQDNLSYMKDFRPLSQDEQITVKKAQEALNAVESIPCTACHYCTAGCPKRIPIPEIFAARNKQLIWERIEKGKADYEQAVKNAGTASDCIACGQCERVCPQQIPVIERLKECAEAFGK